MNPSSRVKSKIKPRWFVRLGPVEWAKHTHERPADDTLQLLGSARRGMQSGALARREGEFVLLVGDHETALSKSDNKEIAALVERTKTFAYSPPFTPAPPPSAPPPVVIIKRRRIVAPTER